LIVARDIRQVKHKSCKTKNLLLEPERKCIFFSIPREWTEYIGLIKIYLDELAVYKIYKYLYNLITTDLEKH